MDLRNGHYSLDNAELAANRAFPLLLLWRGTMLANVVLFVASVAYFGSQFLAKERSYTPVEYDLLTIYLASIPAMLLVAGISLLQLSTLQRLSKRATAFWAVATIIGITAVVLATPVAIGLTWIENGPNLTAVFLIPELWLLIEIARGWVSLARLSPSDRDLVRLQAVGLFSRDTLAGYLGFPPMARFLGEHRYTARVLFLLGTFFCGAFFIVLLGVSSQAATATQRLESQIFLLIALPIVALILLGLGNTFTTIARAFSRQSIEALITADRRPPVLFLRAFRDDQVKLGLPDLSFLSRLVSFGVPAESLDTVLVDEATPYGPLVALGNPRDPYPPYGAARGYFEHKDWQAAVRGLLQSSRAVVLCMDDTEAVAWELATIVESDHLDKTLLLIPPKFSAPDENAEIVSYLLAGLGPDMPRPELVKTSTMPDQRVIGMFFDSSKGWEILTTKSFSRQAYLMALRRFLRCKFGLDVRPAMEEDRRARLSDMPATAARPVRAIETLMKPPQAALSVFNVASLSLLVVWIGSQFPEWLLQRLFDWHRNLNFGANPSFDSLSLLAAFIIAGGVFATMRWWARTRPAPSLVAAGAALVLLFIHFQYFPTQYFVALISGSISFALMRWIGGSSRAASLAIAVLTFGAIFAQLHFTLERWQGDPSPWVEGGPTAYDLATLLLSCIACAVVYLVASFTVATAHRGKGVLLALLFGIATLCFTVAYRSYEHAFLTSDLNNVVLTGFNVPELLVQFWKVLFYARDYAFTLFQSAEAAAVIASLAYGLGLNVRGAR
jgi:hypothetical protein